VSHTKIIEELELPIWRNYSDLNFLSHAIVLLGGLWDLLARPIIQAIGIKNNVFLKQNFLFESKLLELKPEEEHAGIIFLLVVQ
jgi:hypothetical protein